MPGPPLVSYQVVPPETGLDSGGSTSSVYSTYGYATLTDSPTSAVAVYGTGIDHQPLQQTTFVYVPQQGETHTIYSYESTKDEEEIVQSPEIFHSSPATVIADSENTAYAILHTQPATAYVQRATVSSNRSRHYIVTSSGNIGVSTATAQQIPISATQTQTFLIRPATNSLPTSTQQQTQAIYNRSYVYKPVVTGTPQPPLVIPASSIANIPASTARTVVSSTSQGPSSLNNPTTPRPNSNYVHYVPPRPSFNKPSGTKSKSQKKDPIDQKGVDEEVARNVSQILNASMNLNHRLSNCSSSSSSRSYSSSSSSNSSSKSAKKQQQQQQQQEQPHVCGACNKTVSSIRNLSRHRQSCKAAHQITLSPVNTKPASVPSSTPPAFRTEQPDISPSQDVPQSAPPTVEHVVQPSFAEKNTVAERVNYVNITVPTSASIRESSQRIAYVQSVSSSTNSLPHPHVQTYVPVVIKEQPLMSSVQSQLFELRTSEVQLANGQQATIIYDQYAIADPNSYNLSDGPHCDEQLLDNAVADLSNNPLTLIDSNDLSGLNPVVHMQVATSLPAATAHSPTSMGTLVTSSSGSTTKSKPPVVYQCESCSKVVCSARSLKRHRSTCKKYLEQFGHLLEDPQVKLDAIGNCSVRTSTTNVCEACSRQLCSSSNLKRHRATCKAFPTSGECADGQGELVAGEEEESIQSGSVKSEADEQNVQPSTLTFNACSSSTDPSTVSLTSSVNEKPWITVGEHLRAQHNQKQRELQLQKMAAAQIDHGSIDGTDDFFEATTTMTALPNDPVIFEESKTVDSSTTPLASIITTEPLSSERLSAAYGVTSQKPIKHTKLLSPSESSKMEATTVQVVSTTTTAAKKSNPKEDLRYECPECSKTFSYSCRKNVKRHRMTVHKLTLEQIQQSDPVRVVVVSKVDSSSMTTYSHVLDDNGTTDAGARIQPSAITTVVPISEDSFPVASSSSRESLPPVSCSSVQSSYIAADSRNEVVSSMEDFEFPGKELRRDTEISRAPASVVEMDSAVGYTMSLENCDYGIADNTTCAELAEADTTFSEEVDDFEESRHTVSPPSLTLGYNPFTQLSVSLSPAVAAAPVRVPSQSLPSPKVAQQATATTQLVISTTSGSPFPSEAKIMKAAHVCEACAKSLSSEYSLKRHKSTCQVYKAMMEQQKKSSVSSGTPSPQITIDGEIFEPQIQKVESANRVSTRSTTVAKFDSATSGEETVLLEKMPPFEEKYNRSVESSESESSEMDGSDLLTPEQKNVLFKEREETESVEVVVEALINLMCDEVFIDEPRVEHVAKTSISNDSQIDNAQINGLPVESNQNQELPFNDTESTTTSSTESVTTRSSVQNMENGYGPLISIRKRTMFDDIINVTDPDSEDDGLPDLKRIRLESYDGSGEKARDSSLINGQNGNNDDELDNESAVFPFEQRPSISSIDDVVIYVGSVFFELPKQFLTSHSRHFGQLFTGNPQEREFVLSEEVTCSAFEETLGVLAEQVELHRTNIDCVLLVAHRLKFTRLFKQCRRFIKHTLSVYFLMHAIRLADDFGMIHVKNRLIRSAGTSALQAFNKSDQYPLMSIGLKSKLWEEWGKRI